MEGHGVVDLDDERDYNGGRGTLVAYLRENPNDARWDGLRDDNGAFVARDDVFVTYQKERRENSRRHTGALTVGFAVYDDAHHFGPELGIGRVLGDRFDEPVLLVKTAWGGKSLAKDFLPPSADGETGPFYAQMVAEYRDAVAKAASDHPQFQGYEPKLCGIVWFQGWNDACDKEATKVYGRNLTMLIADLRSEFGDAQLPFVVGETGNWDGADFRAQQKAGCEDPSVATNARFVPTRQFLRKPEDSPNKGHGHHWYGNGGSYLEVGWAMGCAMRELVAVREQVE
ncbi:MAG: hypothetical protein RLZZ562_1567 [Planctomycetota bacterium]